MTIDLKDLKRLHEAGGVAFTQHQGWQYFDLPDDLVEHWKLFLKTQEEYKSILMKYEIIADTNKEDSIKKAKWYVKQVLNALDCTDQMTDDASLMTSGNLTDEEYADITTCFYLNMSFDNIERLTQECNEFTRDEVKSLYNSYIYNYIKIVNEFYYSDYDNEKESVLDIGLQWLRITLDDILEMGDSKNYPKGFRCDSGYWEIDMLEEYIDEGVNEYEHYDAIANFIDTTMSELRCKIKEQRELDGI